MFVFGDEKCGSISGLFHSDLVMCERLNQLVKGNNKMTSVWWYGGGDLRVFVTG